MREDLIRRVNELRGGEVGTLVAQRMRQFRALGYKGNDPWFLELCFCILTANSTAKLGIKIQRELGSDGFMTLAPGELKRRLREAGHRFPNTRANFIIEARKFRDVKKTIKSFENSIGARGWLVKNVKGIGYKEASHFLRNVGFDNLAILDRHVLSVLREHGLIKKTPRQLTRRMYLDIEEKLRKLAQGLDLALGELDLYLWYMKTGEVLK